MKNERVKFNPKQFLYFLILTVSIVLNAHAQTAPADKPDVRPLIFGETIERPIKGGERHFYTVELKQGQLLQINAQEKGIDVGVFLYRPADKQIIARANFGFGYDREVFTDVIEQAGLYDVVIVAPKSDLNGNYQFTATTKETATTGDLEQIKAEKLLAEGFASRNQGTEEGLRGAIAKWEESLSLWKKIGEKYWEGFTANYLGTVYDVLGEKQKALDYYNQSLLLRRLVGDKRGEARTLNNIGTVYDVLGEKQKALDYYNQSLLLRRLVGDKRGEAVTLNNIGKVYDDLGEKQKALDYYNQSLLLRRLIGDKSGEAVTLNNIGRVYDVLGEKQKALDYYNQSLLLTRTVGDKSGEAVTLNNIGGVYDILGEKQKALNYYNQALTLFRAVGDKRGEAVILSNIGLVYDALDEKQKALDYYNQSLPLTHAVGDKLQEASTLNNIGGVYDILGEKQKALDYYNQALTLFRAVRDKRGEARTLANIGAVYVYADLGEKQKALEYFQASLLLNKAVGNKSQQASTLDWLMFYWKSLNNPRFAVFYGKQSVNKFQELRQAIQGLDKETQKTFLKTIEDTYRRLAEIMIAEGRLSEAQQILNSFKDQQFFDFDQAQVKQSTPLSVTPREADFISLYERTSGRVGEIGEQLEELKRTIGNRQPTAEENVRVQKLETDLKTASGEFLAVLKRAEAEFSQKPDAKDKVGEVPDLKQMQTALDELNRQTGQKAATVYQLVGKENFSVIVITADDIKSVSTPVKNSVLNARALDFWALLQSPVYNPNLVGKELYDIIFKPLEKELPEGTKTILWALDGNLRYVPMAALFDGKQYLAERYNHVNFTRADKERMTRAVKPVWTAIGLGTSEAKTVELLGNRIFFDALPGVGEELKMLFKQKDVSGGIFDGETWRDAKFTKQAMLDALKQKRPLVHIASHFSFRPGDEARSFLLLGDGSAFTLEEMKSKSNLFEGVELLTLSACNTAAQQSGANGREIDGFAELAQRLGANSVMATLWAVADCSTPWLMREFYDLKLTKNQNKAESLRQAQLALLSGKAGIKPCGIRTDLSPIKIVIIEKPQDRKPQTDTTRSDIIYLDKKDAPVWDKEKHPPFAHPYYWSPFVLFGNWR